MGRKHFLRPLYLLGGVIGLLSACGPGLNDGVTSLVGGYHYIANDSVDRYIAKEGVLVVPHAVIAYKVENNVVVAMQLQGKQLQCKSPWGRIKAVEDEVIYWVVDTSTDLIYYSTSRKLINSKLVSLELAKVDFNEDVAHQQYASWVALVRDIDLSQCDEVKVEAMVATELKPRKEKVTDLFSGR